MQESLSLFKQWANHKSFSNAPLVLAFTKKDVYDRTFSAEALKRVFPKFEGSTSEEGVSFIQKLYESQMTKRATSAPYKSYVLDTTSALETSSLLNSIRQVRMQLWGQGAPTVPACHWPNTPPHF